MINTINKMILFVHDNTFSGCVVRRTSGSCWTKLEEEKHSWRGKCTCFGYCRYYKR